MLPGLIIIGERNMFNRECPRCKYQNISKNCCVICSYNFDSHGEVFVGTDEFKPKEVEDLQRRFDLQSLLCDPEQYGKSQSVKKKKKKKSQVSKKNFQKRLGLLEDRFKSNNQTPKCNSKIKATQTDENDTAIKVGQTINLFKFRYNSYFKCKCVKKDSSKKLIKILYEHNGEEQWIDPSKHKFSLEPMSERSEEQIRITAYKQDTAIQIPRFNKDRSIPHLSFDFMKLGKTNGKPQDPHYGSKDKDILATLSYDSIDESLG